MKMNKIIALALCGSLLLPVAYSFASEALDEPIVTRQSPPQIDLDNFDPNIAEHMLLTCGAFTLKGKDAAELKPFIDKALVKNHEILSLPIELLETALPRPGEPFHGFDDQFKKTAAQVADKKANEERIRKGLAPFTKIHKQKAIHCKPYFADNVPAGHEMLVTKECYHAGLKVLYKVYDLFSKHFVAPENRSDLSDDRQSVLTGRLYEPLTQTEKEDGNVVSIRNHTDFNTMTLLAANAQGLEMKISGKWTSVPHDGIIVMIDDWFIFQTRNPDFKPCVHRVLDVPVQRDALALFLNPKFTEIQETPLGGKVDYKTYLFGNNKPAYVNLDLN
jgi:hypothetical protein